MTHSAGLSIRRLHRRGTRTEVLIQSRLQRRVGERIDIRRTALREEEVHLVAVVADDERLVSRDGRRRGIEWMIRKHAAIEHRTEAARRGIAADAPATAVRHERARAGFVPSPPARPGASRRAHRAAARHCDSSTSSCFSTIAVVAIADSIGYTRMPGPLSIDALLKYGDADGSA